METGLKDERMEQGDKPRMGVYVGGGDYCKNSNKKLEVWREGRSASTHLEMTSSRGRALGMNNTFQLAVKILVREQNQRHRRWERPCTAN